MVDLSFCLSYSQLVLSALPSLYFNLSVCWVGSSEQGDHLVIKPHSLKPIGAEMRVKKVWQEESG